MAIAFDAVGHGDNLSTGGPSGSLTFAHIIGAGSNMGLFVMIDMINNATDVLTTVTYAGVSMTRIQGPINDAGNGNGNSWFYTYFLANPTTGTNNVIVSNSAAATTFTVAVSLSYSGTSATQPDGQSTATATNGSTADITGTITTTTAGDWGIMMVGLGRSIAASTGSTLRYTFSNGQGAVFDSGAAFVSTGSNSMAWHSTASGGGSYTYIIDGVKAFTASVVNSNFFFAVDR